MTKKFMCERALREKYILADTQFVNMGTRSEGKVRDLYLRERDVVMITTDRQSAFDRLLAVVPFKGRVLTGVSCYWYKEVADIAAHQFVDVPHPNVQVVKRLNMLPLEFVVRGYLTGVSATSVWTAYARGEREFAGYRLEDGLAKNTAFDAPLLTPSTKSAAGDETLSAGEVVRRGLVTQAEWDECAEVVMALFQRGQERARERGLILVDTKYELGRDINGTLTIGDELHTPDSSRYWLADDYAKRVAMGEEPRYIDKEFLRLWFKQRCDPYTAEALPSVPQDLVVELALRYVELYERITGQDFPFPSDAEWEAARSAGGMNAELYAKLKGYKLPEMG